MDTLWRTFIALKQSKKLSTAHPRFSTGCPQVIHTLSTLFREVRVKSKPRGRNNNFTGWRSYPQKRGSPTTATALKNFFFYLSHRRRGPRERSWTGVNQERPSATCGEACGSAKDRLSTMRNRESLKRRSLNFDLNTSGEFHDDLLSAPFSNVC